MGFLVPVFAAFAVLAAVPLLVHLYGRPRAERRRFAAIRFLLESDRKTAVRRRVREVALLSARAAAIAAVPLLLAKPYLETRSPLASSIGESESAVIVLDDSRSMSFHAAGLGSGLLGPTLLSAAQARARRLVAGLGRDSEAAVLLTSQGAAAPQAELTADRVRLEEAIAAVVPSLRPGDTTAALRRAAAILAASAAASPHKARRVYLLSDMAAHGFTAAAPWGEGGPALVPLDVGGRLGQAAAAHLAVVDLRVGPAPQLGPRGLELSATIANHGPSAVQEVPITLRVDGKAVAKGLVDVAARGKADKKFFHVFASKEATGDAAALDGAPRTDPGPRVHDTVVELPPDALPSDDRRYLRIEERRGLRVLLLDGDPRTVRRDDELFYLETALRPGDRGDSRIAVRIATLDDLPTLRLESEDVVFAANLKAPDRDRAARLTAYVEGGGGLFLSVGDNVDPDPWNDAFGDLLPQPLATVRTVGSTLRARKDGESIEGGLAPPASDGEHIARLERGHPVLAPFDGSLNGALAGALGAAGLGAHGPAQALREARIGRYALLRPVPRSSGGDERDPRALLRLDSGAPLLVEGRKGKGRVLLCTTTVDRDWGDLAIQPGFLPLVQQAARYLARAPLEAPAPSSLVGQPVEIAVGEGDSRLEVTLPGGARRWFGEDRVLGRRSVHFTDTAEPGLYHVAVGQEGSLPGTTAALARPGGLTQRPAATFAVDVDPVESDLAPIDPAQLAALARGAAGPTGEAPRHRMELWHQLGAILLLLLLAESLLTLRR